MGTSKVSLADARANCAAMSILNCPSHLISVDSAPKVYEAEKATIDTGKYRVDAKYELAQVKT